MNRRRILRRAARRGYLLLAARHRRRMSSKLSLAICSRWRWYCRQLGRVALIAIEAPEDRDEGDTAWRFDVTYPDERAAAAYDDAFDWEGRGGGNVIDTLAAMREFAEIADGLHLDEMLLLSTVIAVHDL